MKKQDFAWVCLGLIAMFAVSCREPPRADTQSRSASDTSAVAASPANTAAFATPAATPELPPAGQPQVVHTVDADGKAVIKLPNKWGRDPARFPAGWLVVDALFKPDSSASAEGEVRDGSRLTVQTKNVRQIRLQLDDSSLPPDSRASRPLELDGQIFEITAQSGPVLRFERHPTTGQWVQITTKRGK